MRPEGPYKAQPRKQNKVALGNQFDYECSGGKSTTKPGTLVVVYPEGVYLPLVGSFKMSYRPALVESLGGAHGELVRERPLLAKIVKFLYF